MPPSKTQFFGNPTAETNIVLASASATGLNNSKFLYTMQTYMIREDIYLLDYYILRTIIYDTNNQGTPYFKSSFSRFSGVDKRWCHWGDYFKQENILGNIHGINTFDITILPNIELLSPSYDELNKFYKRVNSTINPTIKYRFHNNQPNEDSPLITHLNYIFSLRGFSINLQGFSDYDEAETYLPPFKDQVHPRVEGIFNNPNFDYPIFLNTDEYIICREYNIYNSIKNLIYLGYSSTLPDYSLSNPSLNNINKNKPIKILAEITDNLFEDNPEFGSPNDFFIDFSSPLYFSKNKVYNKKSIDIYKNKISFNNYDNLKIIQKRYLQNITRDPDSELNLQPQMFSIQQWLLDYNDRTKIYNNI